MKPKTVAVLVALIALVGVADSVLLTLDHQAYQLGQESGIGVCTASGGCDVARRSALSAIPLGRRAGLPIAVLGLAFYLALVVVAARRIVGRESDEAERDTARLLLATSLAAVGYSAFLAAWSLSKGAICPYCAVLYGVNLALLVVAVLGRGEGLRAWLAGVWHAAWSKTAGLMAAVFVLATIATYWIYAAPLGDPKALAVTVTVNKTRLAIHTEGRPSKGPADAPIHIVEFADLQCPHCRGLYRDLSALVDERPGQVRVTFMHFPLDSMCNPAMTRPFHLRACYLARVGACLGAQGHFVEAAEWLFSEASRLGEPAIIAHARQLGADPARFQRCIESDEAKLRVLTDTVSGIGVGVTATPTFFINGRGVRGGRPLEFIERVIDELLAKAAGGAR